MKFQYGDHLAPKVHLVASTQLRYPFFEAHPEELKEYDSETLPIYKGIIVGDDSTYDDDYLDDHDLATGKNEADVLVEFAGRLCYMSFNNPSGRTNAEYITNIKKQKHYSVLEHGTVTFMCENIDRALTHELIRHRHLSPSELSQRYVDRSDAQIVVPPLYRSDPTLAQRYIDMMMQAQENYQELVEASERRHPGLKRKQIREAARRVLGEGFETKIVMTGNLRAWYEMLTKRYSIAADASILELAEEIRNQLADMYPNIFGDVELQTY